MGKKKKSLATKFEFRCYLLIRNKGAKMKNGGANLISLQRRNNFIAVGFVGRLSATKQISSLKDPNSDEVVAKKSFHLSLNHFSDKTLICH